jgi:hypothetical protein
MNTLNVSIGTVFNIKWDGNNLYSRVGIKAEKKIEVALDISGDHDNITERS